jgi:hypothetical protein
VSGETGRPKTALQCRRIYKWIAPVKSPSWKLAVRGVESLSDGSAEDSNGHSGADDFLHTTHTNPALIRYMRKKTGHRPHL